MRILGGAVASLGSIALNSWLVMLLMGAWHSVRDAVPAIGYGESFLLTLVVWLLIGPSLAAHSD